MSYDSCRDLTRFQEEVTDNEGQQAVAKRSRSVPHQESSENIEPAGSIFASQPSSGDWAKLLRLRQGVHDPCVGCLDQFGSCRIDIQLRCHRILSQQTDHGFDGSTAAFDSTVDEVSRVVDLFCRESEQDASECRHHCNRSTEERAEHHTERNDHCHLKPDGNIRLGEVPPEWIFTRSQVDAALRDTQILTSVKTFDDQDQLPVLVHQVFKNAQLARLVVIGAFGEKWQGVRLLRIH